MGHSVGYVLMVLGALVVFAMCMVIFCWLLYNIGNIIYERSEKKRKLKKRIDTCLATCTCQDCNKWSRYDNVTIPLGYCEYWCQQTGGEGFCFLAWPRETEEEE